MGGWGWVGGVHACVCVCVCVQARAGRWNIVGICVLRTQKSNLKLQSLNEHKTHQFTNNNTMAHWLKGIRFFSLHEKH